MSSLARRQVLTGLAQLPLAAVLADPRLARAAAAGLESVSITTKGGRKVAAALALPKAVPAPAVLLVHEWWGLNDQIKAVAAQLAKEGYVALAVDLYDGGVADTPDGARALMQQVDGDAATDTLVSWTGWLRAHDRVGERIATIGWCFGGGWSLNASIAAPVEATVVYYGRVNRTAEDLKNLKGPVLGHFATRDGWINQEMVGGFETAMKKAGKSVKNHWYEADHAFANPTSARYDEADAKLAWQRTLAFFKANL
ncbi:MAG: dienelactone hydrolase family protein [Rhodospirillales bacterium]|nr:dienelactone hydrolase family protein [Rhodospirillales bacterium]MDH3793158.1 dienelactone hydrolase family protein [Rhodospirillales bacterium]MDH3910086.1 dienelactone hydrolase family protein [Rhodospirillales bacterium]MDH3917993.1 dienelactone hydrolase family protein [Rhodospirillales bacterium]MDH3965595.1 dienelactone hydrolase family protein [Rhodospirillales bacterium]